MEEVECRRCGETFANVYQLGPHLRACKVGWADANSNCSSFSDSNNDSSVAESQSESEDANSNCSSFPDSNNDGRVAESQFTLAQLAQRDTHTSGVTTPVVLNNPLRIQHNPALTVTYTDAQKMWRKYVETVYGLCSEDFWSLFHVVNGEKGVCADAVLKCTKQLLKKQPQVANTFFRK